MPNHAVSARSVPRGWSPLPSRSKEQHPDYGPCEVWRHSQHRFKNPIIKAMSKRYKLSALRRAAEDLKEQYPGVEVTRDTASFANGAIALDFGARLIYCQQLSVIEIVTDFATKLEVIAKIKDLMQRLENQQVAQAQTKI